MKIIIIYIIILHAKWHYSRIHFSNHSIEIKDNMTFWQYPVLLYILYIMLYISRALDGNRKENYLIPGIFFYHHNRSFIVIIIHSECPYLKPFPVPPLIPLPPPTPFPKHIHNLTRTNLTKSKIKTLESQLIKTFFNDFLWNVAGCQIWVAGFVVKCESAIGSFTPMLYRYIQKCVTVEFNTTKQIIQDWPLPILQKMKAKHHSEKTHTYSYLDNHLSVISLSIFFLTFCFCYNRKFFFMMRYYMC